MPIKTKWLHLGMLCLLASANCLSQHTGKLFTQLTPKQTGIDFTNSIRENEALNVLAYEYFYNGGGVAIGDLNNDGLPDIYFTANLKPNKLFLNLGGFQFKDISRNAGIGGRKDWKTGVTMADVNGDGWLDIYVCYAGKGDSRSRRNELFINNKDLTFTESAAKYGLDDQGCSTQAAFFDYDLDGDLDCYVLNHNIKAYKNIELHHLKTDYDTLAADRLYRNDNGKFIDVSREAGISGNPISFGLGIAVSDINNDGWPDLYISNDYTEQDYCYINNRNGSFSAREHYMFSHLSQFSMGSDIADINNDGLVDILTLDMLPPDNRRQKLLQAQENYELYQDMATNGFHYQFMRNMLHLNNGNGTFSEIGQLSGISNTDWSWAPLFADLDNDGNKDLFVTNGYMRDYTNKDFLKYWGDYLVKQVVKRDSINYMDIIAMMPVTLLPNYAFRNNGDLQFNDVSQHWGLDQLALSNGAAYADLDNDGDLDLVVNNINMEAAIFKNNTSNDDQHQFLRIKLNGEGKNRYGVGAKLNCYVGDRLLYAEQMPTRGYQSSISEVLNIGLGYAIAIDSLHICWPGGKCETKFGLKTNQTLALNQSDAKMYTHMLPQKHRKLFSAMAPFVDFAHLQLEYNDFKRQPLMPAMLSPCGPRFKVGDLDNNGLDDIFIGGSQGQSSACYLQDKAGEFRLLENPDFFADSLATTTDILFFDANKDGLLDIYAVSGGYADYTNGDERLQDRLFLQLRKGMFAKQPGALPSMPVSKSCVASADVDADGDDDLFVGGRVIPGAYPATPKSFLLINNGKGQFADHTSKWNNLLHEIGMVTDAAFADINHDKKPDLLLTGEWMAPTFFINKGNILEQTDLGTGTLNGWWNTFELFDMDNDGDQDLVAGNWGLNSQMRASVEEPASLVWKDFDSNGSLDPLLCFYLQGKSYPYVSRDELLDQVYPMRRKFTSYKSYADATLTDIYPASELETASRLQATHLATTLFENKDGQFVARSLPLQAQFSPVYRILAEDYNSDGKIDLLLLGNNDNVRLKMGKMDANFGTVLLNNGDGSYRYSKPTETGLLVVGDVKDAAIVKIEGKSILVIGINNSGWMNYRIN
ncbi:MAG TPA: VCBS repeat-containing protein [Chitinophagaceae bacterium]